VALHLFNELTRVEARSLAVGAIALLPVGATEQHGPHLPTGTDSFAVERIARGAAEAAAVPVVVAPTLPFGSSSHHIPFGGTMSVATETYYRLVRDLCTSLIQGGWRRIFILNGHGGNNELVQLAARDLALEHNVDLAASSYWVTAWDELVAAGGEIGRLPGHAGAFESSVMLALRPELVREPRPHRDEPPPPAGPSFYPPVRIERHGAWQEIDGYSDSPDRATAELGQRFLDVAIQSIAAALDDFHRVTERTA
jgi:creatinine amidohydrolase